MQNYTIHQGFLLFLLLLLFSSCTKRYTLFDTSEKKIVGEWKFEKVTFHRTFSITGTDVSEEFEDIIFDFNDDNSLIRTNLVSGNVQEGFWIIDSEWVYYIDEGQEIETLQATLRDNSLGIVFPLEWEYLIVTNKKITAQQNVDGGYFKYKLVRL